MKVKNILFCISTLLLCYQAHSQEFDSFCIFPDTLNSLTLEEAECGRRDWEKKHAQFTVCDVSDGFPKSDQQYWKSADGLIVISGYYDGFSGLDIYFRETSNTYATWVVELNMQDSSTLRITQLDSVNFPELIEISYAYTFGGGRGIIEESHGEIWNVKTKERIATYSRFFTLSGHNSSVNDSVFTDESIVYTREITFINGRLIFSESTQTKNSRLKDLGEPLRNYERETKSDCARQVYSYSGGRFIKVKH